MSGPGESVPHVPPVDYPLTSLVGVDVPKAFNEAIVAATQKNDTTYNEQLLRWAMQGAECERMNHEAKLTGRSK